MFNRLVKRPAWVAMTLVMLSAHLPAAVCRGETAQWDEPAIDTWAYTNGFGGGSRLQAPSFGGIFLDEETNELAPNGSGGPARLGSLLMAFETTDLIEAGLAPHRYAINSVTVTARVESGSVGSLPYSEQPITPTGLLNEAQGGGIDSQKPMELFGVGFRDGYEGFALGVDQTGDRLAESTSIYGANGYRAYPLVGDGSDGYRDVSNNLTGGFSATEPTAETAPFDAVPWSIGATGLNEGGAVPNNTTFTFDVDLSQPGVLSYLQTSLADGSLGFFVSSVHPAAQPGSPGGGAYPQWYAKEAVGVFPNAEAASLSIDFTILPLPGDYDGNGLVESADYDTWAAAYGTEVATLGAGADGNADGVVDAADYTVWRDAFAVADPPEAAAVPEPSSAVYTLAALATASFCFGQIALTSPRGRSS